jgi:hypothetical protein
MATRRTATKRPQGTPRSPASPSVGELLAVLASASDDALARLCAQRGLRARTHAQQRAALEGAYRDDPAALLGDLRRRDLVLLFAVVYAFGEAWTGRERPGRARRDALEIAALRVFRAGGVGPLARAVGSLDACEGED